MITPELIHIVNCPFWDKEVSIYRIENFLSENDFSLIKDYVFSFAELSLHSQNFDSKTIIDENGKETSLMGYFRNRPFRKVWHLGHYPGYWQQSKETIYDFALNTALPAMLHPILLRLIRKCKEVSILQEDWIPTRTIVNLLGNGRTLDGHCDANLNETDIDGEAHTVSATLYIRLPSKGGNLWFADGFVSHPTENSLAIFNGAHAYHGVSAVNDEDPNFVRFALTTRFVRARDLLFPADAAMLYPPKPGMFDNYYV